MRNPLAYLWASPWTALGLAIGLAGALTGGTIRVRNGLVECHGGFVRWMLEHFPRHPMAMTLGHVVIGLTEAALDITAEHELVHVRQYERWGPFLNPAYLACSFVLWLRGRDAYRENPFEREAYGE